MKWRPGGSRTYWGLTILMVAIGLYLVLRTPMHPQLGVIQKLLYIHLPVAINTILGASVVFIASVAYLGGRRRHWDLLAHAAAEVTLLNGTVLLLTGMVWAKVTWGVWWMWSPRLCISLILWLMYGAYLLLRSRVSGAQHRATVGSIYGVVAFLNVPLLYLSVKLIPDIHPPTSGLGPGTYGPLGVWFIALALFSAGAIGASYTVSAALDAGEGVPEVAS